MSSMKANKAVIAATYKPDEAGFPDPDAVLAPGFVSHDAFQRAMTFDAEGPVHGRS